MTFPRITLDQATRLIIDHRGKTPKKLGSDWTTSGHRVVSALNIKGSRIDENDHHYVDSETFAKWMKVPLTAGDTLMTSEAPLGEVAYLKQDVDWVLGQRLYALRSNPASTIGRYLFYALQSPLVRHDLESRSTGTTVFGISQVELRKVQIPCPPIAEQRRIAGVLGTLDDKIESNLKLIEQLLTTATTAVITRITSSRPKYMRVGELGRIVTGKTPSTKRAEYYGGETPFVTIPDFNGSYSVTRTRRSLSGQGVAAVRKQVIPKNSVIVSCIATVGISAITSETCVTNQQINAVIPDKSIVTPQYLLVLMREFRADLETLGGGGSVYLNVSKGKFSNLKLPILTLKDQESLFPQFLHEYLCHLERENVAITKLRDVLLPELMSGRMRVNEAGRLVSEALDEEVADA